jgi:hypothetical protein
MEGDDDSAPELRDREKSLQVEASKPRLGFVGRPIGALNPFPRLLAETREKLDNAIRRDDALAKKAIASSVGASDGGNKSGQKSAAGANERWRDEAKIDARKFLNENPDISVNELTKTIVGWLNPDVDFSTVYRYLATLLNTKVLKRPHAPPDAQP